MTAVLTSRFCFATRIMWRATFRILSIIVARFFWQASVCIRSDLSKADDAKVEKRSSVLLSYFLTATISSRTVGSSSRNSGSAVAPTASK